VVDPLPRDVALEFAQMLQQQLLTQDQLNTAYIRQLPVASMSVSEVRHALNGGRGGERQSRRGGRTLRPVNQLPTATMLGPTSALTLGDLVVQQERSQPRLPAVGRAR
jgi:hypothetical protein